MKFSYLFSTLLLLVMFALVGGIVTTIFFSERNLSAAITRVSSFLFDDEEPILEKNETLESLLVAPIATDTMPKKILVIGSNEKIIDELLKHTLYKDRLDIIHESSRGVQQLQYKYKHYEHVFIFKEEYSFWRPSYEYDYVVIAEPIKKSFIYKLIAVSQLLLKKQGYFLYYYDSSELSRITEQWKPYIIKRVVLQAQKPSLVIEHMSGHAEDISIQQFLQH